MTYVKQIILVCLLFSSCFFAHPQITAERIRLYVSSAEFSSLDLRFHEQVRSFYGQYAYKPVWITSNAVERRNAMFDFLRSAPDLGLNTFDYLPRNYAVLGSFISFLNNQDDSLKTEMRLTGALIHYLHDIKNGNKKPTFDFEGFQYTPSLDSLIPLLMQGVELNNFYPLIYSLEPDCDIYRQMKNRLVEWNNLINDKEFKEVIISSKNIDLGNSNLLLKIYQLGFLQPGDKVDEKVLVEKVKTVQKFFDLASDGVLGKNTLNAFNVPIQTRREELKLALNYVRWINEIRKNDNIALLNIPSAQLLIYKTGALIFDSRIIVGKPSTPTATLTSSIKEVIVYPYWNVPHSIATKELLPHIKKSIGYLGRNNYQVLNHQGKVVDPYSINWHAFNSNYFPYQIRQATGCDNALGILKFNFYNPFSMYLHDTPGKSLFLLSRRFFSHGCMRVEKPIELARLLLKQKISSVEDLINQCVENQSPVTIQLEEPLPLMVLYSPVWFDEKGQVKFFEDVYNKMLYRQSANAKKH